MIMNNFHRFQNFRQLSNLFSRIWLKKRHTSLFSGICREIRTKFHKTFAEKCKLWRKKWNNSEIQYSFAKKCSRFLAEILRLKNGAKVCKSCTSRQELSNEYLLAKIGVDTAENEPLKVHWIIQPWDLIFTEPPRPDMPEGPASGFSLRGPF